MNQESREPIEGGKGADRSQLNGRKWVILLVTALLAGGLTGTGATNQAQEPGYKGYSLYEWLCHYEAVDQSFPLRDRHFTKVALEEALRIPTAAVRQIGTNAIPSLLAWIENAPPWARINDLNTSERMALHRARLAVTGFQLLGAEARSACSALGRLASDPQKEVVAERALEALINIGGDAVPELVSILTNTNAPWRYKAAEDVGSLGTNGLAALPALLGCVSDQDDMVASFAAVALTELPA